MSGFADYLEKKLLDLVFSSAAYSIPATLYCGLYTVTPNDDGTGGTEVTGGSYARVSITNNATNFPAASGGNPSIKSNGVSLTFPVATGSWGTVVGVGIFDASTSGNLLAWNSLVGVSYDYTATTADLFTAPGSSFSANDTVRLLYTTGGTTPTGVSLNTTYYVVGLSGTTFNLSLTSGGSAIDITAAGSGRVALISPKIVVNGDATSFSAGTLIITLD